MEGALVKSLQNAWIKKHGTAPFHTCALKINHHGSRHNTSGDFVEWFNPRIAVFSALFNRSFGGTYLPTKEAIQRLRGEVDLPFNPPASPPRRFRNKCSLFFTFRHSDRIDAAAKRYESWARNDLVQDIILQVKEENNGSPFNDIAPQIMIFRRERNSITMVPRKGHNLGVPYMVIQCDRLHRGKHTPLELPMLP